jgi:hypothetical protein
MKALLGAGTPCTAARIGIPTTVLALVGAPARLSNMGVTRRGGAHRWKFSCSIVASDTGTPRAAKSTAASRLHDLVCVGSSSWCQRQVVLRCDIVDEIAESECKVCVDAQTRERRPHRDQPGPDGPGEGSSVRAARRHGRQAREPAGDPRRWRRARLPHDRADVPEHSERRQPVRQQPRSRRVPGRAPRDPHRPDLVTPALPNGAPVYAPVSNHLCFP